MPPLAILALASLSVLAVPAFPRRARAGAVHGTVVLSPDLKIGRRFPGYWRPIENGSVPIQPLPHRGDTVVVLAGVKGAPPPAKTITVEIAGLQATPSTVVVGEGSVVEFKNQDRVAHDLFIPDEPNLMAVERLNPNGMRRQKFLVAGGYQVTCAEYPSLSVSVVVVGSPYFAVVDDKGGFKIADAPDGKATLKVWHQGHWLNETPIDVGPKSGELTIKLAGASARSTAHDKPATE